MRKRQDRHSQRECKKWALQIPPETRHVVAMDATQRVTYVGCLAIVVPAPHGALA